MVVGGGGGVGDKMGYYCGGILAWFVQAVNNCKKRMTVVTSPLTH